MEKIQTTCESDDTTHTVIQKAFKLRFCHPKDLIDVLLMRYVVFCLYKGKSQS